MDEGMRVSRENLMIQEENEDVKDQVEKDGPSPYLSAVKGGLEKNKQQMGNRSTQNGMRLDFVEYLNEELVITMENVKSESSYWFNALIGYVVGDKIPYVAVKALYKLDVGGWLS
ncbi:hypothetical protein Droror1_Dr00023616 [Drosera rotundifolia]